MAAADEEEWRELQTRWYQWGAFLPLFRSHGQFPVREVFNIAPEDHPAYKERLSIISCVTAYFLILIHWQDMPIIMIIHCCGDW